MAGRSLGTLTLDLVARVGGFLAGMDRAERSSDEWRRRVQSNVKLAGAAIAGMAGIAATAAGAGIALLKSTSDQVVESDRMAKALRMSTQELMAWQFAASKAGLEGDNIADIFKDLNDKIGDAVLNQSGDAAEALDHLGLSAKKLSQISPDKQLLEISKAVGKLSTQAEKTNILESLGNDLSKMLPLFENNNEKLKQFIELAKDYGVAPKQEDIDDLIKVNEFFQDIETSVTSLKMEIAKGLAKVDLSPFSDSVNDIRKTLTDPEVLQGLSDLVTGMAQIAGFMIRTAAEAGKLAAIASSFSLGVNSGLTNQVNIRGYNDKDSIDARIAILRKQLDEANSPEMEVARRYGSAPSIDDIEKEIAALEQRKKAIDDNVSASNALKLTQEPLSDFKLGSGDSNSKPTGGSGSSKDNKFDQRVLNLKKQIALIDETGKKSKKTSELQKLNFDLTEGSLSSLNEGQKDRLKLLASEVDRLNEVKKQNEENKKALEFIKNLKSSNEGDRNSLNVDLVGSGFGQENKKRMQEMYSIQKDFLERQQDLQKQYQNDQISEGLYNRETQALKDALEERLEIQKEYYEDADEQRGDWQGGIQSAVDDYADKFTNTYQLAADAMKSIMDDATSSISDHLMNIVNGSESVGDAIKGVFADLGQSVIKVLVDMAAQWLVYQATQLLFGKTTQATASASMISNAQAMSIQAQLAAYASTAAIPIVGPALAPAAMATAAAVTEPLAAMVSATSLAGMAHDGIASVPQTGTWLLQQGERVVAANTSAKLDSTLDRVANQTSSGNVYAPQISIPINGNPSDATIALVKKAADEGARRGYQQAVQSINSGTGDLYKAMRTKTNAGRKIR